jgi:hypothetical protein
MAVGIIHTLEVIQIAHKNCGRDSLAPGTGKFPPQQINNHAAIPESCQPVMSGLETHLFACLNETVFEIKDTQTGA